MVNLSIQQLAEIVQGEFNGDPNIAVEGISPLNSATSKDLTFLFDPRYIKYLDSTEAAVVILTKQHAEKCSTNYIVVPDPYVAYALVSNVFNNAPDTIVGIHPSAVVDSSVEIGKNVSIGPNTSIYSGVTIGDNVVIGANCVIRENVVLGDNACLYDNVSIYHGCTLGKNIVLHSGVVIGADGFGIAKSAGKWIKISQLGGVIIHDDVEVGANTTIDRGAMDNTVIHQGVKLDNQIQIGHNVSIGKNTAIAGCTGIAGSTKIGEDCLIGGRVGIAGHNTIANNVTLVAFSGVRGSLKKPGIYSGAIGCMDYKKWNKIEARIKKIDTYVDKLKKLEEKIQSIEEK
ncbi:MAG: UDP-3-O-(3-hydroxymyristoyl)glucosamine N-acyltransferase [Legionellales bacterium]|nr:UDP-3-O-(3-hydroxymyristoyl)glucosamine N-acyltransferase [Legionellales bacterium]